MASSHPPDLHARLARQSLRRALIPAEIALADALERIFASGEHEFAAVAEALNAAAIARPSGDKGAWSEKTLQAELQRINADLDEHYATVPLL